ncbi:MAG: rhodanese-like domain-containing protein [Cyclobacteriaceae bacterium]
MKSREVISIVIMVFGLTAAMFPARQNDSIALDETELLQEMLLGSNHVSVDELAELLINGDPSIRLIDVRPAIQFEKPLPRAINIPIDSIFAENYAYLFDQSMTKNIIYAQDDQLAVQVWMMTRQMGYANNYLLKGGLNAWNRDILDPQYPESSASNEAFELYEKRMASRQFFTGAKALPKIDFKPIAPVRGKKKKRVQGGCS